MNTTSAYPHADGVDHTLSYSTAGMNRPLAYSSGHDGMEAPMSSFGQLPSMDDILTSYPEILDRVSVH